MHDKIDKDLKQAMLSGDKVKAEVLRGLKNALHYETVSLNARESGLDQEQAQKVLAREAKKRQEAADIYKQAGEASRAEAELTEKKFIEAYLPEQLSEEDIAAAVNQAVARVKDLNPADMGKIIGAVRSQLGAQADGATIARLVKEKLSK
jgi:uncharacterized protein